MYHGASGERPALTSTFRVGLVASSLLTFRILDTNGDDVASPSPSCPPAPPPPPPPHQHSLHEADSVIAASHECIEPPRSHWGKEGTYRISTAALTCQNTRTHHTHIHIHTRPPARPPVCPHNRTESSVLHLAPPTRALLLSCLSRIPVSQDTPRCPNRGPSASDLSTPLHTLTTFTLLTVPAGRHQQRLHTIENTLFRPRTDCWTAQTHIIITHSSPPPPGTRRPFDHSTAAELGIHHSPAAVTAEPMAEVLSPLSSPTSTITMLHSRPSSSDAFNGSSQQYSTSPRQGQQTRSMYNGQNNSYRSTATAPVQPYAFQSTPTLRQDNRSVSQSTASHGIIGQKQAHTHTQSVSNSSTTSSDASSQPSAKDDSVIGSKNSSLINLSSAVPDLSLTNFDQPAKPSPGRYRRAAAPRTESGNTTPKAAPQAAAASMPLANVVSQSTQERPASQLTQRRESQDDMAVKSGSAELAKRYRRRSMNNTIDTNVLQTGAGAPLPESAQAASSSNLLTIRPVSSHTRSGSDDSTASRRKTPGGTQESAKMVTGLRPEGQKSPSIPPRTSSETGKLAKGPSPLAKEADSEATMIGSAQKPKTYAAAAQAGVQAHAQAQSAAAQQLAAVSDRDLNKGMKSRLRRAFSFGSAQELRRSAAENNEAANAAAHQAQQKRMQHQQHIDDELDAEQQEIARKQEAGGLGASIYANTSVALTGSTDNISISSTASSASMMLRKMGRGAKKSARSVKGLFRPKSVIGVPAADGPVSTQAQPSVAQVSMVSVEAERHKVNVDAHPAEKHGITGFPKLERNSIDAANNIGLPTNRGSGDRSDSFSRRSIVGSDRDRAEVLAAVKKGILKRSGTASPSGSPVIKPADAQNGSESPASSMPSTPKDGVRSDSMKNAVNGDYFSPRLASVAKSMPNTPNGSRNISFSPRIQFHDVWSSTEYDRRGEIATCNRLTPMLAQQIKEELNTFKMVSDPRAHVQMNACLHRRQEMEVHEMSKPHTHFF